MTTRTAPLARGVGTRHAFEAGWLVAAVLIPAAITHEDFMLGFIQMPKVFVLRTVALYLVAVFVIEWAAGRGQTADEKRPLLARLWAAVAGHPARLVILGAIAVLLSHLVSVAFAPVKSIAIWGIDPGWDTYGLFSLAAYLVLFAAVATHLRTEAQLKRLIWALTSVSVAISLLSVAQHFGVDPFKSDPSPVVRTQSTFGNPIFGASYLVMTLPLTITLFAGYRHRLSLPVHIGVGAELVALQFAALLFSLSRGPWVGFATMMIALSVLLAWTRGLRVLGLAAAITAVGMAIAFGLSAIPVASLVRGPTKLIERVGSVAPQIAAGLSSRSIIWTTAADVYLGVPWVDTELYPEIPELGFAPLRRIVGYGPDMFGYAYPLAGESTYTNELASHGHSFYVHTIIELGILGLASYAFLFVALVIVLFRMVRAARGGAYPEWFVLLAVGLSAALVGRVIEQIPGKAQISDLTLSWLLAAVVVAMSTMRFDDEPTPAGPQRRPRRRRDPRGARYSPLRVAGAAAATLVLIGFWVQAVVVYPVSARVGARATEAAKAGDSQGALDLYIEARNIAPDLPVNRMRLSQALFGAAGRATDEDRSSLVEQAYEEMQAVLQRNPLDHRAWSRAGEYLRELSADSDAVSPADGVRDSQILVQLMPGFWQPQMALAWSYVRLGAYEEGLRAVARAKALAATTGRDDAQLVHYVEAVALENLGRIDEAVVAAELATRPRSYPPADQLLARLTATPASDTAP